MKANAPEKIYIQSFNVSEEDVKFDKSKMFFDDVWTEEPELGQENIEYVRTDAFIEKAEEFFEEYLTEEDCKFGASEWVELKSNFESMDSFIRAFENYIKKK